MHKERTAIPDRFTSEFKYRTWIISLPPFSLILPEGGSNDDLITELEFTEALLGLSKDTAPGPDRAKYSDIKKLSVENKSELFRRKLRNKTGLVTQLPQAIPKPGTDHSKLNSNHILTTQNTTGKLMEQIVARNLAQDLERRDVLPPNQGGY